MMTSSNGRVGLAAALLLIVCLVTSRATAQPPPLLPVSGDGGDAATAEPNVRRIYVPTTELQSLLTGDRQGVLLPRDEFRKLYAAARKQEADRLVAPADLVVSSASLAAQIDDDQLQMTATIRFTQFADGWQTARLPLAGLSLASAQLDGQPAALARDEQDRSTLTLFSDQPGDHELTLELSSPLRSVGSDWLVEFQTLGAPAGELTLTVPDGKSLLIDGLKQQAHADAEPATYSVPLGGRPRVSLRITDRDLRHAADALVFATSAYGLQVMPGEVTWTTTTSVQTYGQSLSQLSFTVPSELEVAAVESTGLEEWTLEEVNRGRRTRITLRYRQPFEGERTVIIRGVLVPESEDWTVPNLVLEDADSHAATLLVRHGPEVRLQSDFGEEVRPISGEPGSRTLQFRTMDPDFDLEFRTLGKQRSVQVAMTNLLDISDDGLGLQTVMDVETLFLPLFDVRVALPAEFEVTSALIGDSPVEWTLASNAAGTIEVRIPLDPPLSSGETRRVRVLSHADPEDWPVESEPVLLAFPEVGLTQADMVEARYGIMADADLDVRTQELTGLDPARKADIESLQEIATALGKQLRLGFNYQDTTFSGQLEVTRKSTRLAVSTLSLSRIDPQLVRTALRAYVTVEGGGTQGLLIDLPEETGTDLRFRITPVLSEQSAPNIGNQLPIDSLPVAIVEQTVSESADGRRTWALRFDRRLRGSHLLQVALNQPHTAEDGDVTLPVATFTGAERQNGWIAIEARPEQNLQVEATSASGQPLQRVDPVDLPELDNDKNEQRRIVAGVRYVQPDYTVTISEELFAPVGVPTAIADQLRTTSVLSTSGLLEHQLDLQFRAVGVQSLRFVVPEGTDVWSVLIDNQPVEVRQAQRTYQVPLSASNDPEATRSLRITLRSKIASSTMGGRLEQLPPLIAAVSGSGEVQPLEILQQDWTLHYPRDVVLLTSDGQYAPTTELPPAGWLSRGRDLLNVPTLAEAGWKIGIAAVVALVLACAGIVAQRLGGRRLMEFVVVGLILAILVALLLPATQQAREAARRTQALTELAAESATAEQLADHEFAGGEAAAKAAFEEDFARPATRAAEPTAPLPADAAFDAPQMPVLQESIRVQQATSGRDVAETAPAGSTSFAEPTPPRVRGALLSLALDLQSPADTQTQEFQTLGWDRTGHLPTLDVTYGSRSLREVISLIIATGLALLMWWQRNAAIKTRLVFVLLTIVLPIALVPVTPPWATMIVEGTLLGGLAGGALWLLLALVRCLASLCEKWCPPHWTSHRSTSATTAALLLACSCLMIGKASAEEPLTTQVPAANHSDHSPSSAESLPTVILPYNGDKPLDADRVYLPQTLFRDLWLKAHPDQRPRPAASVPGLVAEALYAIEIPDVAGQEPAEAQVQVRGRFALISFRDVPIWLTLPLDEVAIQSATIGSDNAVLQTDGNGRLQVLIDAAGSHVLDLTFDVPAELRNAAGAFALPLHPVAAGALTLSLPPADGERTIRVISDRQQPVGFRTTDLPDGRQKVDLAVDQDQSLRVSWQPKATRGGTDNIIHATALTAIDISDEGVELVADYDYQVRQGVLGEVPFRFPESVRLKRILGDDVGGWQIDGTGDERTLTVFLRRNVDDATQITVELFLPVDDRSDEFELATPPFAPLQVTRETGQIAVLAGEHLEVRSTATEGLRQLNRSDVTLPQALKDQASRVQLAYRYVARPWTLELNVQPKPPASSAVAEHGVSVGQRRVLYASRFVFDLQGAPQQTLTIGLTDEFLVTSVRGDLIDDWFVEEAELVLDLGQPRTGQVEVVLEGHLPRDAGSNTATIITPLPYDLEEQESLLAVWVDPMYSARLDTFDTWRTIDRAQLPGDLLALQSQPPQFGFQSSAAEPEIINLNVIRQQPQLSADAIVLIAVSDVSVDYGLTLRWTIERAATDRLAFTVPDWLQDQLEIQGEGIRQTTQTATDDGRVRWDVELTDTVRGQFLLSAVATLPPPLDGTVAAPRVIFEQPPAAPEGTHAAVDAQQCFAVVVNLSRSQLIPNGEYSSLAVRREQLPFVLREDLLAQAMAMVRLPQETDVAWIWQPAAIQQMQPAQVSSAELTSVLALDGSVRTRAQYRVRNRGQQFLAIQLPDSARILSILVRDKPARGLAAQIGETPVTLIPLPQTSAADLSFLVEVVIADQLADVTRLDSRALGQELDLPAPRIVSPLQSAEFGMPVVYTIWTVSLPEDLEAEVIRNQVDGTPRTNLTFQRPETASAIGELQLYRELEDLSRLVTSKATSGAQRITALSNLKTLQKQIELSRASRSSSRDYFESLASEDQQLARQSEELLEQSQRSIEQAERQLREDRWEFEGESAAETNYFGKNFVIGNSMSIITDNRGDGVQFTQEQLEQFQLNSSAADQKQELAKGQQPARKPADSRSQLRGRLQSQLPVDSLQQMAAPQAGTSLGIAGGGFEGGGGFAAGEALGGLASGRFDDFSLDGNQAAEGIQLGQLGAVMREADGTWGKTGGLSLPVDLPLQGQTLTFTKPGGDPRLTISIRPEQTGKLAMHWLWAIVIFAAGAWLLHHLAQRTQFEQVRGGLTVACITVGLVALLSLPPVLSILGGAVLVFGIVEGLLQRRVG